VRKLDFVGSHGDLLFVAMSYGHFCGRPLLLTLFQHHTVCDVGNKARERIRGKLKNIFLPTPDTANRLAVW
jgi:hypothetical protein